MLACDADESRHNGVVSDSSASVPSVLPAADRPDVAARLRQALLGASFTADGLLDLLGAPAYAALARRSSSPSAVKEAPSRA